MQAIEEKIEVVVVDADNNGERIDKFLAKTITSISRTRVKALIEEGCVSINNKKLDQVSYKVREGEELSVIIPKPVPTDLAPAPEIKLDIIYEDDDLIVLNKQAGVSVHPAHPLDQRTIVNALLAHCGDRLSSIGGVIRPGIVHRLDKDTTGLMLVAKNDNTHRDLSEQLAVRSLSRQYIALCWGVPNPPFATIVTQIAINPHHRTKMRIVKTGGKEAITKFRVLKHYGESAFSKVECTLDTGRTHQIRVHMAHRGHSLVGDPYYEKPLLKSLRAFDDEAKVAITTFPRQALHAFRISFIHPTTEEEMEFKVPLPDDILKLEKILDSSIKTN